MSLRDCRPPCSRRRAPLTLTADDEAMDVEVPATTPRDVDFAITWRPTTN